jgi:FkbM family methyltransferase
MIADGSDGYRSRWLPFLARKLHTLRGAPRECSRPPLEPASARLVIIDAGAGVAWNLPLFHQSVGDKGRILAVEANPKTFECLKAMVRWNAYRNVLTCNAALMDSGGTVYVEDRPPETYTRSNVSRERRALDLPTPGESATLDKLCDRFDIAEIALLKINIEESEGVAVLGMTKAISRSRAVVVGCHDFDALPTRETVSNSPVTHGFSVWAATTSATS